MGPEGLAAVKALLIEEAGRQLLIQNLDWSGEVGGSGRGNGGRGRGWLVYGWFQ